MFACLFVSLFPYLCFLVETAAPLPSWNITVNSITSSSATVWWSNFPLPLPVNYYLVRYKKVPNGVSRLFQVSQSSNTYYMSHLKAYTSYYVQLIAVAARSVNVTYSSKAVVIQTDEDGKSGGSSLRQTTCGYTVQECL